MFCLPLIERELRVALRKQRPAQRRFKMAALAVSVSMFCLWLAGMTRDPEVGRTLEKILCAAGLYFVARAPMLTAGVLAEERRNQTLGLLFVSGLGASEVFAGKFLSAALIAVTNLLAIFPMLALPFLTGGVSYNLFLAIICGLPALMLCALAVSLLASALAREDGTAFVLACAFGAILCVLMPAVYLAQFQFSHGAKPSLWWLRLSPAYGPWLAGRGFDTGFGASDKTEFWRNLALTLGWSALALSAAAFALKRVWREREEDAQADGWRKRWREFWHGGRESRRRLGRLWLDENPYVWLAGRDRQPAMLGWLATGAIVAVWLLCWALWPSEWPSAPNCLLTAFMLNTALAWMGRNTAAQEFGLARRDGAFELLLTTPLDSSDIVWGQLQALRRRFLAPANFVLCLEGLMMLGGLATRTWNKGALIVYACLWSFLLTWSWSLGHRWSRVLPVMWASLNCGRPAYAVWRTSGFNSWFWIWIAWQFRFIDRRFPTGSGWEVSLVLILTATWLLISLLKFLFAGLNSGMHDFTWDAQAKVFRRRNPPFERRMDNCDGRLIGEFREIVREPLPEPNDPRFKHWNPRERFPWRKGLSMNTLLKVAKDSSAELS